MDTGRSRQGPESPQIPGGLTGPQSQLDATGMRRRRRSSWNPATWSPGAPWLTPNPGYRAPGTPGGRDFAPTEHLNPEAVAAFADGELAMTPHLRAGRHLAVCAECTAAVDAQIAASKRLRTSGSVEIPASLLGQLAQIPTREFDMRRVVDGNHLDASGFPVHDAQGAHDAQSVRSAVTDNTDGRAPRRWGR